MNRRSNPISRCNCDHRAPSMQEIRSVEFNHVQAERLDALGMSSASITDLIWIELFKHRTGKLIDPDGKRIAFDTHDPAAVRRYDSAVGDERRHFVKRYRTRAAHGFRNRLQERLVYPATMIFLALEVRHCRLSGRCASSGLPKRHVDPIHFDD
ncbi:hypothetical protein GOZ96_12330 [Agrobacterium vitis]|uniref:Uncharacterized protein n=1 Tax=Agrobacterium vitis TaxID=373 RepID=A0A368NQ55_AGRVI|nr:hypothetical protein [Agrobacterium vitis]KAA3516967.1 hypothetical protein DXM22_10965 [Agrobacterium vitis]KAA3529732.1 hypothetical protein DXT89_08490 [Agrobacterium vitis]MUZ97389.1 hypothetical protein [Agrobacterium vitis]NOJ36233.1 hypothetical protein [Agrobacterium vitis]RCU52286.1 hypothetical protein ASB66_019325 [Agrobacterium vitis]